MAQIGYGAIEADRVALPNFSSASSVPPCFMVFVEHKEMLQG